MHRNVLTASVAAGILTTVFLLASRVGLAQATPAPQDVPDRGPFKPVAELEMLMEAQESHLHGMEDALKTPGEKAFKVVRFHAQVLAELANVNRFHRDKADYVSWATQLRDTALELAGKAAQGSDADTGAMLGLVEKLKSTCTACHDVYD